MWEPRQGVNDKQKKPVIKKLACRCATGIDMEVMSKPEEWVFPSLQ